MNNNSISIAPQLRRGRRKRHCRLHEFELRLNGIGSYGFEKIGFELVVKCVQRWCVLERFFTWLGRLYCFIQWFLWWRGDSRQTSQKTVERIADFSTRILAPCLLGLPYYGEISDW